MIGAATIRATTASDDVDDPLGHRQPRGLPEPVGEDEPARAQVLDRDLAGVLLVDRGEVRERDAVDLHLEQRVHRQGAARVRQADDHAVHAPGAHDRRDVLDRANHARVEHRLAHACGIGIDEPDQLHADLAAHRVQLLRQRDGAGAGTDDEQALARRDVRHHPLEREAPADDGHDHQHGGDQDDAAADDQPRESSSRGRRGQTRSRPAPAPSGRTARGGRRSRGGRRDRRSTGRSGTPPR